MGERTQKGARKKKKPFPGKALALAAILAIILAGGFVIWSQQAPEPAEKTAAELRQPSSSPSTAVEPEASPAPEVPETVSPEPEVEEPVQEKQRKPPKQKKKTRGAPVMTKATAGDTFPLGKWVKIQTLTPSGDPVVLGLKVNSLLELNDSEKASVLSSIEDSSAVEGVSFYKYSYSVKWISGGSLQYQSIWSNLTAYGEYGEPIVSIRPETLGWCRTQYFVKKFSKSETTSSCMVTAPYDEDGAPRGVKYTRAGTDFEDEGVYFSVSES